MMAQNKTNISQDPPKDKNAPTPHSFMKDDFPLIRKALIVLIATLLTSTVLVETGSIILTKQQVNLSQAQAELNDALNKRRQAEADKQEIHNSQDKYIQLCEQGFVGEERRLDWITHIKSIRENRKLLPISYEISAQRVFQVAPEFSTDNLELHGSKMKLQMDLLHEGDLLNFLDDLKHKGFYSVQECTIKRGATETENTYQPLAAECVLYWLTLGEQTGCPEQPPQ